MALPHRFFRRGPGGWDTTFFENLPNTDFLPPPPRKILYLRLVLVIFLGYNLNRASMCRSSIPFIFVWEAAKKVLFF